MRAAVIIPNGNGRHLLTDCLSALDRQTYRDFEVVVVDNRSTDGSVELVRSTFPAVRVVELDYDGAFAGAVNEGIRRTGHELIALLNNDTEPEPDWLAELIGALDATPGAGMAASKLLLWDRRDHFHSAGDFYGLDGIPGSRGVWRHDDGRYDADRCVFGACGGAAVYRRAMLDDIGLLDASLVAYCEDVDLNLRALLAGYRCAFAPRARVYHRLSATGGGPFASYYVARNILIVLARDVPSSILRRYWPKMLAAQARRALESLRHLREPAARATLRGQWAGLRCLPTALLRRRDVARRTRVDPAILEAFMVRGDAPLGDDAFDPTPRSVRPGR